MQLRYNRMAQAAIGLFLAAWSVVLASALLRPEMIQGDMGMWLAGAGFGRLIILPAVAVVLARRSLSAFARVLIVDTLALPRRLDVLDERANAGEPAHRLDGLRLRRDHRPISRQSQDGSDAATAADIRQTRDLSARYFDGVEEPVGVGEAPCFGLAQA
jgi:hypothetical protein